MSTDLVKPDPRSIADRYRDRDREDVAMLTAALRRQEAVRPPRQDAVRITLPVGPLALVGMFLVMFAMKLAGSLPDLSWWWVTAPLWGQLAVLGGVVVAAVLVALARAVVKLIRDVRARKRKAAQ